MLDKCGHQDPGQTKLSDTSDSESSNPLVCCLVENTPGHT